jgi:serine-type D-Ala-D-Ala carboxypeptidase/endopeptidase (penicillin-binding protein 4)
VAVLIAGCGGGGKAQSTSPLASTDTPVPDAVHHAHKHHQAPPPSPAVLAFRSALGKLFSSEGNATGGEVYDLTAHTSLFDLRQNFGRPPASVEKLWTTVASLQMMGPGMELQTAVLGRGHLGPGGVWHGDLYLRGGGDPTFGDAGFNRGFEQGQGPTPSQLVAQLRSDGITRVTGKVIGDGSLFDARRGGPNTSFAPDIPDIGGQLAALTFDHGATAPRLSPAAFAARELALTMKGSGIKASAAKFTEPASHVSKVLATVKSPPLMELLKLMDVPSDDFFAEMLTKQLGARFGGAGSTAAGARVIRQTIAADYTLHPKIVDGSGLSRSDGSTPSQVVALLHRVWHTPVGRDLAAALPIVGVNGTVQTIATKTAAQGHCIAKTGTLNYVTNLAGYCQARGGHELAFALFIDGPPNWTAILALGKMVAAIARY